MKAENFGRQNWSANVCYFYNDSKSFLIHIRSFNGCEFIWLQLVGSQFEARNFEYSLNVEDPNVGKFSYEGTVRSLDDNQHDIYKTGLGLAILHGVLKKLIQ